MHGKMQNKSYKNDKFKISVPTWNEEFILPDGSYSVSDIQNYSKYIITKHGEKNYNPSIMIYVKKIENRITFNPLDSEGEGRWGKGVCWTPFGMFLLFSHIC